ncbi:TonB-dependent receptor [Pseudoalteromonas shioyasakiensis]|uniref:TonB-dependent receptor n=2 Tax=Pseudoalteromonas TaxID=53246 RepID=UPI000C8B8612|nr:MULTISPECIES: TonB-dependent receptor [Pseudoalteromonas]MAD02839.1 TonB-dependent receptor [Pseudoalteromonas sp.]MCP4586279.1 TonB-dependent receptor [Pseudoalteromonas sp.]MCQ8881748.1 TonB-dependent receptor [Pseudoalteromonas shioyasakiensis]NIZ06519.1 TonB-dependent receptor [Pseudoalteromonas sp. HF66]QLE09117.1 TonB-dependent receptor [Pseudoalteromonas shioyasakiensis]|tara:strand:- start:9087 stop:12038 length:2952 start_codon:yes stop_codon:yes gene_type:complete
MKSTKFIKTPLAASVAMILTAGLGTMSAYAQDEQEKADNDIEVIEIKGIRGSMIRAMDMKRDATGVVDAISAEEMGKFPDTNLAESLQRITGVSVSRSNGEGSEITVRGFGPEFNLVMLNGRQMPGTGYTRSYALENIAADGVSALEVAKSGQADVPSGGLGATVNIITTRPLNSPGEKFSSSIKAIHDSSNEKGDDVTPEFSAMYSNTYADDTFGFAASFSHQERDFQQQSANIQGWQANVDLPTLDEGEYIDPRPLDSEGNRVGNHFFPKDMNYSIADVERERTNGQVTLQYSPVESFTATVDYTASRAITGVNTVGWGIWNEFGGNINGYELDENGTALYADISGNDGSFTASRVTTEVKARSIGLNLEWQINDQWEVEFDYHDSKNETDNGADDGLGSDGQIILGSDQLKSKVYDYRTGEIPHAYVNWNNGTTVLDPSEIDSNFSQFSYSPGESKVEQAQLHTTWFNESFEIPLVKVKFGAANTKQTMGGFTAWSGLRGGPGFNPSFTEILPDGMFTYNETGDMLDQFAGGGSALEPNYYYTYSFEEALARQLAFLNEDLLGDNQYSIDPFFDGIDSESYVEEKTQSFYVNSLWEFDVANYFVQINAGLRYEETDVTSTVRQRVESQVNWVSASEWIMQYETGGTDNFYQEEGNYDIWLPNIDVKVEITDELVGRVSWGKTMARAPLGNLAGGRSLSGSPKPGSRTGGQGNTSLLPFESTNLDLSLEYYYGEGSYASLGYFKKDVDNFIQTQITETTIDGLHDILNGPRYQEAVASVEARGEQATSDAIFNEMLALGYGNADGAIEPTSSDPLMVWNISQPQNTDSKSVDGFELAVQHLFGESGFGLGVNATFVDGDVEFDVDSLTQQAPLSGLSDSANFQAFYDKDGLSVKVTYAWRDSYLIGVGQSQGSSDAPPQFGDTYGQWDLSVNYDINENMTVFFEGINLNNETERGYGRYEEQFLFARQYGPRYTIGARYSF